MRGALYSFVVHDEECPGCGRDTAKQDAIHIQAVDTWTYASANAPHGTVTEDEMSLNDPSEEDCPDLILDTKDVVISCTRCGHVLTFSVEQEQ